VHEQKVQNLEYEHKNSRRGVQQDGEASIQKELEGHNERIYDRGIEKGQLKWKLRDQQLANSDEVKMLRQGFSKSLAKLRQNFEDNHRELERQYENQVEQLKVDLELCRKVEIHEIEERKNQHINELLFNHQTAFDEIKSYYNDITHDNLQLIKSLKDEINEMKEKEKKNQKRMAQLTQENRDLTEPLHKKQADRSELEEQLRSYAKDKMALKNLRAHAKQLEERINEAKQEYHTSEDRVRKMERERDDLHRKFQKAVRDIQHKADIGKNVVLEKKVQALTAQFDERQAQLTEVLSQSKLDPQVVANVTKQLEKVLGTKNREIKELQYQVHQRTKAYNDTIRVYEAKLPALGISSEEIGFEPIQTATSNMPARLVTRTK